MAAITKRYSREERIEQIKACGQAIIDNAEQIYGNFEYPQDLIITVTVGTDRIPTLEYKREFLTQGIIESISLLNIG